jgi:P-type Mg2+ transporter
MGTSVVTGNATAIIMNTGNETYFGRKAKQLEIRNPPNAFQLGVRRISWIFFLTMSCLVPPVLLLQGFLNGNWSDALMFSLSVAVGLTPEMLPMIVNTTLAKGTVEMSKKKCIVKNLDAIVNMGGIDVLCTDKTGTLTKSIVVLTKHIDQSGKESRVPLRLAYLNAHFQQTLSNPMDDAVNSFYASQVKELGRNTSSISKLLKFSARRIKATCKT